MASIALQMVEPAIGGREDKHEKAMFAVFEVAKMLKKLKADYQAMWHGEKRGAPWKRRRRSIRKRNRQRLAAHARRLRR
jgi:hypothetical protein